MRHRGRQASVVVLLFAVLAALLTFPGARPAAAAAGTGAAPAVLSIDPGYVYLHAAPGGTAEATVRITAPKDDLMHLHVNAGWLAADAGDFFGSRTVRLTASAANMKPGDVRVARAEFTDFDRDMIVPVVLVAGDGATPPPVAASPDRVDFGKVSDARNSESYINLAFSPQAGSDVTITADADWFVAWPMEPTGGAYRQVSIYPVWTHLVPGRRYEGNVVVRTGSQPPLLIPVSLEMASPGRPVAPDEAGPFRDVPAAHWAADAITELTAAGVIQGLGDGQFGPDDPVTREQFAKLLVLGLGLPVGAAPQSPPFPDLPADTWSAPYIEAAKSFMPRFSDGRYHPDRAATRQEIAAALALAKGLTPITSDSYFKDAYDIAKSLQPYVAAARRAGLISGFPDRTFHPTDPVTRAEVAAMVQRARLICGSDARTDCPRPLGPEDRTLLSVSLAGGRDAAEATLGQPEAEQPGYINAYTRSYRNGQVEVAYVTPWQTVWSVRVTGAGATARGIAIGDSVAAVRKAYGPAEVEHGAMWYQAGSDLDFFSLKFEIVEGKVHAIRIEQSK